MTNARLIEELDRSREQFSHQADAERALREIAARITAIRDPSDLLQHVVDEAARLLARRARPDRPDHAGRRPRRVHPHAGRRRHHRRGGRRRRAAGRSPTARAARRSRPAPAVVSGDYANDAGFEHNPDLDAAVRADGVKSLIVTPLSGESGMLGVLQVGSPDVNAFGPAEVGLVEALAHQAAIAIQNARLIEAIAASREEVRRRARAEQALREIATRITAIRDPADLLKQVVDASRDLLDADRAELDLIEPDTGLVRLAHVSGDGDLNRPGPTGLGGVPGDRGINGLAIAHRRAVVTGDYLTDDRFTHTDDFDTFVAESGIHSVVVAPLFTDDGLLGVIKVSAQDRDAYDDEDAALMEAFADQATVAIQNARLIEELGRSREEISRRADAERALREIAANISAIRDPDAVLQQTVDEARRLLESDGARIDLLEDDTLTWAYASGATSTQTRAEGRDMTFKVGEGVAGIAVQQGRTFLTDDYLADARFPHIEQSDELVERTGYVSVLAAPMRGEHGSLGSISVSSHRTGAYDEASAQLLQALADQAAITIQNARLIAELNRSRTQLRRRAEEEQSLREIAARISATKGARDVLQRTVDEAARLLAADESRIDLIDADSGLLKWAYHSSASTPYGSWEWPDNPDEKIEQGISGLAVLEARVAWTGDYLNDPGFLHASSSDQYVKEIGINSVMSAPLLDAGRVFGALTIYTRRSEAWGTDDARLIEAIANQAAIAISTARLIEELDRSSAELARRSEAQQSLLEIAARITAIREPGPLLQQVVDAAKRLVAGDGSILDLIVPGENVLRWAYDSGIGEKFTAEDLLQLTIPVGIGASGIAVAEGRVIVAGDRPDELFPVSDINDRFFEVTGYRSMIIAPISGESGPLGALEVYSTEAGAFDDADAAVIRSLAYQAAIAIQNARLIEELGRSREEIARRADTERSLREIAARITAIREPGDLLQHVVQEAARLLASDGAIIDLLDPVTGRIEWGYDSGVSEERRLRWRETFVGEDVVRRSLAERATLFTPDYLDDPRFGHTADQNKKARAVGLRSLAIAPLVSERGALGTLTVFSDRPSQFAAADADLLGVLADQAAIAMTNARLIEELERSQSALEARAERERSLRDIAARITSLRDPGEILARVVEESRRLLGSDGAHLTRLSDEGTYLVPVIVAGGMDDQTEDWLLRMRFPLGGGINGLAAEEVRAIWTYDYLIDPRIPHEAEDVVAAERLGLRAMAAAPLRAPAGEVIGTLAISYRTPREIATDELDLLQGLADQAAIALTNSNLYELLGESEARYRYLVQNSPDLVWSIDAGRPVHVRVRHLRAADRLEARGPPRQALRGARPRELARGRGDRLDRRPGRGPEDRELRGRVNLLHRDGHPIPAEFIAFATRDEAGGFAGANGSVRDMSERDRLERELRESEHRFRFLIANSPDIIFSIDPDGRFSYVSDGVRRSLGVEPEELVGTHVPRPDPVPRRRGPGRPVRAAGRRPRARADDADGPQAARRRGAGVRGQLGRDPARRRVRRDPGRRPRHHRAGAPRAGAARERGALPVPRRELAGRRLLDRRRGQLHVRVRDDRADGRVQPGRAGRRALLAGSSTSGRCRARSSVGTCSSPSPIGCRSSRLLLTRRDGSTVPVEVSSLGQLVDGAFAGIHGSTRDVSERERLETDLRRQAGELASSQERAHLARELHDSVTQALFSMTLVTRTTELLVDRDAEKAKLQLASLRDLQREALAEMRALIFELRPGNIEQDGLLPALRTHAAALQGRIGLPIVVTSDLKDRLPLDLEEVLYRISQEALHNVVKHAAARQVTLSIGKGRGGAPAADRRRRQGLRRGERPRRPPRPRRDAGPGREDRGDARGRLAARRRDDDRGVPAGRRDRGRARRVTGRRGAVTARLTRVIGGMT